MAAHDALRRLGRRLHDLRVQAGFTQESLAARAGITWHFVSAIERGVKTPTLETLVALAGAMDISLSEIFLDVDRPMPREVPRLATALAGKDVETQHRILRVVEEALALVEPPREPAARAAGRTRAKQPRR